MAWVRKFLLMARNMTEFSKLAKKMEVEYFTILMDLSIWGKLLKIIFKAMVYIYGKVEISMMGSGIKIRKMGKVFLYGKMDENTQVSTKMTKKMVLEHTNGHFQRVKSTKENGLMTFNTVEARYSIMITM